MSHEHDLEQVNFVAEYWIATCRCGFQSTAETTQRRAIRIWNTHADDMAVTELVKP